LEEHYIKSLKISKSAFAEALGIAKNTLYKILDGRARITASIAARLSKALKTSPELWRNLQQKIDVWEAKRDPSLKSENIRPIVSLAAHSR
jgi:antitoxin HigA-1